MCDDNIEYVPPEALERQPCRFCSRKFLLDVLKKHESICQKSCKRNRKMFDSGKQRATGTEIPINKTIRPGEQFPKEEKDERIIKSELKKHNWKAKHEEFIENIRSAKAYNTAKARGEPLPPAPSRSSAIDPDLIQCEYCSRRFNERAADRHIPYCKEKHSRPGAHPAAQKTTKPSQIQRTTMEDGKPSTNVQRRDASSASKSNFRSPPTALKSPLADYQSNNARQRTTPKSTASKTRQTPTSIRQSSKDNPSRKSSAASSKTRNSPLPNDENTNHLGAPISPPNRYQSPARKYSESRYAKSSHEVNSCCLYCGHNGNAFENKICCNAAKLHAHSILTEDKNMRRTAIGNSCAPSGDSCQTSSPGHEYAKIPINRNSQVKPQIEPGQPLRSGRTMQNYIEAQRFAKDISEVRPLEVLQDDWNRKVHVRPITTSLRDKNGYILKNSNVEANFLSQNCTTTKSQMPGNFSNCINHNSNNFSNDKISSSGIPVRAMSRSTTQTRLANRPVKQPTQQAAKSRDNCCVECGAKFPNGAARFCPDCGMRRMAL